jgi:Carbohydrate esterase, sialic acid-specific acetylesterase
MKTQYFFIFSILLMIKSNLLTGQFAQISFPVYQGVYQRNNSDNASVPISGQLLGFPSGTTGSYKIECITNRLNSSGVTIAGTTSTDLITNNTVKGYFNGSIIRSKGWYSLQIKYTFNGSNYTSSTYSKFGVGDVFIIAGQSNSGGVQDNLPRTVPSSSSVPEWIVGNNEDWDCKNQFENIPSMTKITGFNRISPKGQSSWCYGILGQKISLSNGNMPVAFFNCGAGGSSILNWKESANNLPTKHPYTYHVINNVLINNQYCNNSSPYVENNEFYGEPYISLKNTLNWYVQLFGVRAILWHQGESDSDNTTSNVSRTRNATTYTSLLNEVIDKSRKHSGIPNLSWMVAKASYTAGNQTAGIGSSTDPSVIYSKNVTDGQGNATILGNIGPTWLGPSTDFQLNSTTSKTGINRLPADNTHFDEASVSNNGLTVLANLWSSKIDPTSSSPTNFNRISSKPIPPISIAQSGSTFTFSISNVPNASVCWITGTRLFPPKPDPVTGVLTGCSSTSNSIVSGGSVRCFIGTPNFLSGTDASVNWISTGLATAQNCPGCREGAEEADETYGGINMKLYPNPSEKDFKVEFDVPENDTHVKLEFFDMAGNSVKVIADGSHAKGHFTYPITESLPTGASICQLKVGEIFINKKMIRVN